MMRMLSEAGRKDGVSLAIIVVSVLVFAGCSMGSNNFRPTPIPALVLDCFAIGMMNATDLPFGWQYGGSYGSETSDGIRRSVIYYGAHFDKQPLVNVSQIMWIYASDTLSTSAYKAAVAEAIPQKSANVWVRPSELSFPTHADEISIACHSVQINDIPAQMRDSSTLR